MPLQGQFGVKDETTPGTKVVVDEFVPFTTDSMKPNKIETQAAGVTSTGSGIARLDQFSSVTAGWQGNVGFQVQDIGQQLWGKRVLGALDAGTEGEDGDTTWVATPASLCGQSWTAQTNKKRGACATTDTALTYGGCKANDWSFTMDNQGNLLFDTGVLAMNGDDSTSLATASYVAGQLGFYWGLTTCKINSVTIPIRSFKVSGNNQEQVDSYLNGTIAEPSQQAIIDSYAIDVVADWTDATKLVVEAGMASGSGNIMPVEITVLSPNLTGASVHRGIKFIGSACSIVAPPPEFVTGKFAVPMTGKVKDNGSDAPLSIAFTSDTPA